MGRKSSNRDSAFDESFNLSWIPNNGSLCCKPTLIVRRNERTCLSASLQVEVRSRSLWTRRWQKGKGGGITGRRVSVLPAETTSREGTSMEGTSEGGTSMEGISEEAATGGGISNAGASMVPVVSGMQGEHPEQRAVAHSKAVALGNGGACGSERPQSAAGGSGVAADALQPSAGKGHGAEGGSVEGSVGQRERVTDDDRNGGNGGVQRPGRQWFIASDAGGGAKGQTGPANGGEIPSSSDLESAAANIGMRELEESSSSTVVGSRIESALPFIVSRLAAASAAAFESPLQAAESTTGSLEMNELIDLDAGEASGAQSGDMPVGIATSADDSDESDTGYISQGISSLPLFAPISLPLQPKPARPPRVYAYISNVCVAERSRRRGIAAALMREAMGRVEQWGE